MKRSLILAAAGTAVGAVIKCFSVSPDRFYLVMIGQVFEGVFTTFTIGLIGRFTALWFGSQEISLAGALSLLGDQVNTIEDFTTQLLLSHSIYIRAYRSSPKRNYFVGGGGSPTN